MLKKNPLIVVVLGAILLAAGFLLPNGVKVTKYAEMIGIYNLLVTACQGLGIGLIIGGGILFLKGMRKGGETQSKATDNVLLDE